MKRKRRVSLLLAAMLLLTGLTQEVQAVSGFGISENSVYAESVSGNEAVVEETVSYGPLLQAVTIPTADSAYTGVDKTGIIKDLNATIKQDNAEIGEGGTLDGSKPFAINVSFSVPVIGDYDDSDGDGVLEGEDSNGDGKIDESDYFRGGDYASVDIPPALTFISLGTSDLISDGVNIGTIEKVEGEAKAIIRFSEELDKHQDIHGLNVHFGMTMRYDGSNDGDSDILEPIEIFGKTITIKVPPKETVMTAEKSGVANVGSKTVAWKIKVNADRKNGDTDTDTADGNLSGYTIADNLAEVGAFVANSFRVGEREDGTDAVSISDDVVYDEDTEEISYTFEEGATGTRWIFFETEIPDEKYYVSGSSKIVNTASLKRGDETVLDNIAAEAPYTMEWITKNGKAIGDGMIDGVYDPTDRKIEWEIVITGSMTEAVMEDILPKGLEFVSAARSEKEGAPYDITKAIQRDDSSGREKLTYEMGDISGKNVIKIVTSVTESEETGKKEFTFDNVASVRGKDIPTINSNNSRVTVGVGTVKKEAVDYDYSTHEMEWKVEVDTKGQELEGNLRTLDLLVYGKSFDVDTIDNIETGFGDIGDLTHVSKETLEKLIPQYGYGQKIKPDSFATEDELEYVVYSLTSDGKKVADLMVVTGKGKKGIPHTGANSYSYSTIICDPDIYATNRSTKILNTVSLFSGETELNSALAAKTIQSNMLAKDSLTRENAALILGDKPLDAQEVLAAINNGGSGTAVDKSFDYQDKSVLYRIYVNGNGLTNATEDLTTVAGEKLGNYKIQDVLPKGWEFRKIQGMDFVLYEAASEREGNTPKITAEALVDSYEDILTMAIAEGTDTQGPAMSFDFKRLTKPYVILLKAGPTKDALEEYFEKNEDYTEKNTVSLVENPNITIPVSGSKDVKISSKVLGKGYQQDGSGEMTWNVEYKPCGTEQEDTFLTDTLPQGIELRVDSKGELVIPGNISITELIHEKDGSYTDGDVLALPDEGILSYDNATRVLTFVPPIKEKAYRLTYVTDITGEPGTISNKAQLYKKGASAVDTASAYSISEDDYGASFLRSGWIQVQKIDGDSKTPLTGAKFTIFSTEGTIIREAKSNADGILSLKTLPEGEYVLKETEAPAGYALSEKSYRIKIEKQENGTFKTDVAGEKLTDGVLTVANFKVGTVGALEVTKIVAGNAGDKNKTFDFTLELRNAAGVELAGDFDYTIKNQEGTIVEEGVLGSGAQFSLSHEQTLRLWNIPKESQYTITEADYAGEGYHTTIDGNESREAAGIIEVDAAASVTIINTKNKPASDNGGNGGQEEDRDSAPATAADSANKAVTIPSESKGVLPKTGRETRAVYYVLGAACIAAGILVLARKDKKKNAKK